MEIGTATNSRGVLFLGYPLEIKDANGQFPFSAGISWLVMFDTTIYTTGGYAVLWLILAFINIIMFIIVLSLIVIDYLLHLLNTLVFLSSIVIVIISTPRFLKFLHVPSVSLLPSSPEGTYVLTWQPGPSVLLKGPSAGITRASWVCHYPAFSLEPWLAGDFTNMAGDFMGTHRGFIWFYAEHRW